MSAQDLSMGISGSQNGGTVPYKAIFCGDIPLHRPYIGLIYGRYLQFRILGHGQSFRMGIHINPELNMD